MANGKILVVDDEKAVRDTFALAFDEYKIITASTGQGALNILSQPNDIDLLILDVMMPGLTGIELLRIAKRMNPKFQIVIMTGHSTKEIAIEALRSGADEYIEKPFDINKTKEVIERLLFRKKEADEDTNADQKDKIKQAQKFVERNYDRQVTLKDVAKEIYLSPKYFSRIFKEQTHKTFNEYRIGLRVKTAKKLLKGNGYTASQVAYMVGYENPESFMKMFKKFTGVTPSQYRTIPNPKTKERKI